MNLADVIRDALARVVSVRELLEDGDYRTADSFLFELELDLAGVVARHTDELKAAA